MGDPFDEILRNHSKGLRRRFYTLWAVLLVVKGKAAQKKLRLKLDRIA